MRPCLRCNILKPLTDYHKAATCSDGRRRVCKTCRNLYNKSQAALPEAKLAKKTVGRKYMQSKYNVDPVFTLKHRLRVRLRGVLRTKGLKRTKSAVKLLGCSAHEFKCYLEKLFKPGMGWYNMDKWEIDHILPLCSATSAEDIYKLCHYTNLQPLWIAENKQKSGKYIKEL